MIDIFLFPERIGELWCQCTVILVYKMEASLCCKIIRLNKWDQLVPIVEILDVGASQEYWEGDSNTYLLTLD